MFKPKILSAFENLKYVGNIENPTYTSIVGSIKEEKIAKLDILVEDNLISDIKFKAFGSPSLIVSLEYVCKKLYKSSILQKPLITSEEIILFFDFNSIEQINAIIAIDIVNDFFKGLK